MAWRRPGDKPLSEPIVARSLTHICVTRPQWVKVICWCVIIVRHCNLHLWYDHKAATSHHNKVNTLRLRQNGHHFADNIFKCIFLNKKVGILIIISLKFVPRGRINNLPTLVQIMAWCRWGYKPLFEPMMASFTDAYMGHSASMG